MHFTKLLMLTNNAILAINNRDTTKPLDIYSSSDCLPVVYVTLNTLNGATTNGTSHSFT